jgi:hypothetical protein
MSTFIASPSLSFLERFLSEGENQYTVGTRALVLYSWEYNERKACRLHAILIVEEQDFETKSDDGYGQVGCL